MSNLTIASAADAEKYRNVQTVSGWAVISAEGVTLPALTSAGWVDIRAEGVTLPALTSAGGVVISAEGVTLPALTSAGGVDISAEGVTLPALQTVSGGVVISAEGVTLPQVAPLLVAGCATREQEIALLDEIRERVLASPESLQMGSWHCGTTHCLAGWGQALRGTINDRTACADGMKLMPRSAHLFYRDNATVLKYLTDREYAA